MSSSINAETKHQELFACYRLTAAQHMCKIEVMLPRAPACTHRTDAAAAAGALMSGIALKSKSILSAPQLLQQLQQLSPSNSSNPQRHTNPKSQPKKLNASTSRSDILAGDNVPYVNTPIKVYAAAGNLDTTSALVNVYPTLPPPSTGVARSLSDAAIVLRIPSSHCMSGSLGAYSASLHATSLAPPATTCEPLATVGAAAIVGPEMLATNQTTCRTACSLILMSPSSRELVMQMWKDEEEIANVGKQKKYLADYQRCWPPPMFIVLVSLLEIFVFIYDYMTIELSTAASTTAPELMGGGGGTPLEISITKSLDTRESLLIYRPDRRLEIWRYVSYMMLHANWLHLSFNVVIQLMCGLPLELVHGSVRVGIIYLAGVFAGSLGTSVVDSQVYLLGASGGVYALLTANLANILLNYKRMRHVFVRMLQIIVVVSCDLCYALYTKYYNTKITTQPEVRAEPTISYIAHLTGALAGFTMGLLILKNFDCPRAVHAKLLWWLALSVYSAFTIFAIAFNLINTVTAQILEEKGEVMEQQLLNNFGIS